MNLPRSVLLILCCLCSLRAQSPKPAVLAQVSSAGHTVTLTWSDIVNPPGTTYKLYRTPVQTTDGCPVGGPFSLLASPISTLSYVDKAVLGGRFYCYFITAFYNGSESARSNTAFAAVPVSGPAGDLRLPLWDFLYYRYWTAETKLDWEYSFGLRLNGDGTQTLYTRSPVLTAGKGTVVVWPADGYGRTQVMVDTAYILNLQFPDQPPDPGSDCYSSGAAAVQVHQDGIYFCVGPEPGGRIPPAGNGGDWRGRPRSECLMRNWIRWLYQIYLRWKIMADFTRLRNALNRIATVVPQIDSGIVALEARLAALEASDQAAQAEINSAADTTEQQATLLEGVRDGLPVVPPPTGS